MIGGRRNASQDWEGPGSLDNWDDGHVSSWSIATPLKSAQSPLSHSSTLQPASTTGIGALCLLQHPVLGVLASALFRDFPGLHRFETLINNVRVS